MNATPPNEAFLVGALLAHPGLLAQYPDLEIEDFQILRWRRAFEAFRNLEAEGKPLTVDATLEQLGERANVLSDGRADGARVQLETQIAKANAPIEVVQEFADRIACELRERTKAAAAIRAEVMATVEAAERAKAAVDAEIDEFALRDAEGELERLGLTVIDDPVVSNPWSDEFAAALADVTTLLGSSPRLVRGPMFVDAVDLLQKRFDAARWLVTGLVTRGAVAMIGGEPKAAIKTWSATELAIAVATGTKAFGEFFADRGRVAYFYAEDLDVQVRNRVRALMAGANRELQPGRLHMQPRGMFLDITRDEDLAWLVASVRRLGEIDLLVLDPMRDIHSAEEDKSDGMRNVMRRLRLLGELLRCAVLVVHHAVKRTKDNAGRGAGQNFRGSSAIHGSLDALLAIQDADGDGTNVFRTRVASQVKGARSAGALDLELRIQDDANGEAEIAWWQYSRAESKKNAPSKADEKAGPESEMDAKMLACIEAKVAAGEFLTPTQYRDLTPAQGRPIPYKKVPQSINRLRESGAIKMDLGRIRLPSSDAQVPEAWRAKQLPLDDSGASKLPATKGNANA